MMTTTKTTTTEEGKDSPPTSPVKETTTTADTKEQQQQEGEEVNDVVVEKEEEKEEEEKAGSVKPPPQPTQPCEKQQPQQPLETMEHFPHTLNEPLKDALGQGGIYTGNTFRGIPHHKGRMIYLNDDEHGIESVESYVGDWQLGYWHGPYGVCTLRNGDIYKGPFVKHQRHGVMGDYTWKETSSKNVRTGQLLVKRRHYQGEFQHNQRHGHGKYTWKTYSGSTNDLVSTSTYVGMFDNGLRQGHGIYTSSKLTYSGEWSNGQYHGYGVLETTKSNTTKYVYKGYFHMGKREGRGSEIALTTTNSSNDGTEETSTSLIRHEGMWKNDRPVEELSPEEELPPGSSDKAVASSGGGNTHKTNLSSSSARNHHTTKSTSSTNEDGLDGDTTLRESTNSATSTHVLSTFEPVQDANGRWGNYRGLVQNGLPQGVGTIHYTDSNRNDTPHGTHRDTTNDISLSDTNQETRNTEDDDDVASYEGFWQAGVKHGFGRCLYKNGDTYVGQFVQNKRQGQGEFDTEERKNQGSLNYKGMFYQDKPQESMTVLYDDFLGSKFLFQGTFQNGARYQGRLEFLATGGYYQGSFNKQGLYHGTGEIVTETSIYKGQFQDGLYHGTGTLRKVTSGEVLIENGEFEQGKLISQMPGDGERNENDDDEVAHNQIKEAELHAFLEEEDIPQPPQELDWDNLFPPESLTSSLLTKLKTSLSPVPQAKPKVSLGNGSGGAGFLAGLLPSLSVSGGSERKSSHSGGGNATDEKACHAVVDLAVWDGQDNPGRYTGLLHISSQRPHGVGRMVYNDGNRIHEGFWEFGHRQGHGRCLFVQIGDYHEGDYHANLRHGPGKYYWKDGRQYIGQYHQDERHGKNGKFIYPNGDFYKGDFEKGQRSGFGIFTFNKKTCLYKGQWKNGVYHGQGLLRWKSPKGEDQQYEGGFAQGLFNGKGEERVDNRLLRKGIYKGGRLVQEDSGDGDEVLEDQIEQMPIMELSVPTSAVSGIIEETNSQDSEDYDIDDEEEFDDVILSDGMTSSIAEADIDAEKKPSEGADGRPRRQKRMPRQKYDAASQDSAMPTRRQSSAIVEVPSSLEQTSEAKRAQWKNSLDISGHNN